MSGDAGIVWEVAGACVCDAVRKRFRRVSGSLGSVRAASVLVRADEAEVCSNGVVDELRVLDTTGSSQMMSSFENSSRLFRKSCCVFSAAVIS